MSYHSLMISEQLNQKVDFGRCKDFNFSQPVPCLFQIVSLKFSSAFFWKFLTVSELPLAPREFCIKFHFLNLYLSIHSYSSQKLRQITNLDPLQFSKAYFSNSNTMVDLQILSKELPIQIQKKGCISRLNTCYQPSQYISDMTLFQNYLTLCWFLGIWEILWAYRAKCTPKRQNRPSDWARRPSFYARL